MTRFRIEAIENAEECCPVCGQDIEHNGYVLLENDKSVGCYCSMGCADEEATNRLHSNPAPKGREYFKARYPGSYLQPAQLAELARWAARSGTSDKHRVSVATTTILALMDALDLEISVWCDCVFVVTPCGPNSSVGVLYADPYSRHNAGDVLD